MDIEKGQSISRLPLVIFFAFMEVKLYPQIALPILLELLLAHLYMLPLHGHQANIRQQIVRLVDQSRTRGCIPGPYPRLNEFLYDLRMGRLP